MVVILIFTAVLTRAGELALAPFLHLTSAGGGGVVTPQDLVSGDQRRIAFDLVQLMLPGILIQAFLVKLAVSSYRGLHIPYVGTAAVLAMFDVGALGAAAVVAHFFADTRGLGALTTLAPATIYLTLVISAATLIAEAFVLQGLVETPVGRYPLMKRA
jgi:hypothetical protein